MWSAAAPDEGSLTSLATRKRVSVGDARSRRFATEWLRDSSGHDAPVVARRDLCRASATNDMCARQGAATPGR